MADAQAPRIGLVSDSDLNRRSLQQLLAEGGYSTGLSLKSAKLMLRLEGNDGAAILQKIEADLDAWIIDSSEDSIQPLLDYLLTESELPLLLNDHVPLIQDQQAFTLWRRRTLEKLEIVAISDVDKHRDEAIAPAAKDVWVLAASLGGPEAVSRFLQALPPDLPLALVYGQHIEPDFEGFLTGSINSHYTLELVKGETVLTVGKVVVVPAAHQLRFLPRGRVVATRKPWQGAYKPVLDQVISDLARVYRQRLGVIIFSGTCNDGEIGCRVVKACGGTVWAQQADSCIDPSMPMAAISTQCVSEQGTPEQLATLLAERYAAAMPSSRSVKCFEKAG